MLKDFSCHMYAAGAGMGQAVGYAASVSDHKQAGMLCFKVFIQFHFHIVELDFHSV